MGSRLGGRFTMLFQKKWRNPSRNIIAYTTHKAGSMVLHRVLKDICELNRIRYYSPNESRTMLPFDRMFAGHDFIAKKRGCFGPIRFFVPTQALTEASVILHLRDPRDVLVSMFYSYCYMHAGEIEPHTGYRKESPRRGSIASCSIWWASRFTPTAVITESAHATKNMSARCAIVTSATLPNCSAGRTRSPFPMKRWSSPFPGWLEKIVGAFDLTIPRRRAPSSPRAMPTVSRAGEEDVWSHKRKVTPGDHREKLQSETIRQLDQIFGPVLDKLGYSWRGLRGNGDSGLSPGCVSRSKR